MSAFTALSKEALLDAVRRRIIAAIILLSVFSLMAIDGFTSCAGNVSVDGQDVQLAEVAVATGAILFVALGLWVTVLASILASDHLQQTLEDGSANLSLARPVSRDTFALARLAGVFAVALATGVVLLGSAAGLLNLRSGLPLGPAMIAGAHAGVAAFVCATFSMALSLWLPRLATMLTMLGFIATMATANLMSFVPREEPWTGSLALLSLWHPGNGGFVAARRYAGRDEAPRSAVRAGGAAHCALPQRQASRHSGSHPSPGLPGLPV